MPSLYQCQTWRCCKTKVSLICSACPIWEGRDNGKEGHQCRKVAQESLHEQHSRDSTLCPLHPPALHSPLPSTPSYLLATTPPPCHLPVALCSVSSATNKQFLPCYPLAKLKGPSRSHTDTTISETFYLSEGCPPPTWIFLSCFIYFKTDRAGCFTLWVPLFLFLFGPYVHGLRIDFAFPTERREVHELLWE